MRPTTINRPRLGGKTAVFSAIFFLQIFLSLFRSEYLGAAVQPSDREMLSISWQKVEKILENRGFVSGDELFQLLSILYTQDRNSSLRLNRGTLLQLNQKITTLFPLEGCESIELRDSQVVFLFTKDQQVAIPNTWRQASLKIARKLVLAIEDNRPAADQKSGDPFELDSGTKSLHFSVLEGSLRLHLSFLLKLFGGAQRDAEGSELVYQINDRQKISRLQLIEKTLLFGDNLKVSQLSRDEKNLEMQWIDILHPDFPGIRDIGISASRIAFLGTDVELLPDSMLRIGKDEPRKNEKAWNWFTDNIKSFRDYLHTGQLSTHINYTRNYGYRFEERQIVMTMGFQGSEEKVPEMITASAGDQ